MTTVAVPVVAAHIPLIDVSRDGCSSSRRSRGSKLLRNQDVLVLEEVVTLVATFADTIVEAEVVGL